ncbi:MAG: metallophosphatase family protein [Bacteroidales bacterium]|nr:metallophosphatase family protein [Bacteroidales bacterium]
MYVGVISDTHGVFSKEFADFLSPADVIWHAGDWGGGLGFVQQVRELGKPVVGVYGNCDGLDIRQEFPEYQFFREEGLSVLITHIGGSPGHYYPRAQQLLKACRPDLFVCGHSHILKIQWDECMAKGFLYMNPGAAGLQGWQVMRTALRFKLQDGRVDALEVFNLPR